MYILSEGAFPTTAVEMSTWDRDPVACKVQHLLSKPYRKSLPGPVVFFNFAFWRHFAFMSFFLLLHVRF